jgi:hypothetical protein
MPNHVTNIVEAPKEVLDSLEGENGDVDFNSIVPMPACLNIEESSDVALGMALINGDVPWNYTPEEFQKFIQSLPKDRLLKMKELGRQAIKNQEEVGHKSWYGWSCDMWGTKWNAYDIERYDDEAVSFQTAWSTPVPAMIALSEKFPEVEIRVRYADEDVAHNCGEYILKDGEFIKDYEPEGGSKEAFEMYFEVCGSDDCYEYSEETGTYEYVEEEEYDN